jgi:hypothetical protein
VCSSCRRPVKIKDPTNSDRRFWLKLFSDEEIVELAFWIFNQQGDVEVVRGWRTLLLPEKAEVSTAA